jgi:TRAP transporter TAXI family solute receptor
MAGISIRNALAGAVVLAVGAVGLGGPAAAYDLKFLNVATASTAGTFYPVGIALAKVWSDKLGVRASAQSSAGSVENVSLLNNNEANIAIIQTNIAQDAVTGRNTFKEKSDLRMIAPLYPSADHIIISKSSGIKSLADLKGKRMAVGTPGSGTLSGTKLILDALGIGLDGIKAEYVSQTQGIAAMKDGTIDAVNMTGGHPIGAVTEALSVAGDRIAIYSMTEKEQNGLVETIGWKLPITFPAGTYPGQAKDIESIAHVAILMVRGDFPTDLAYDMTKTMYGEIKTLEGMHAIFKLMTVDYAKKNLKLMRVPVHPGAQKFFDGM